MTTHPDGQHPPDLEADPHLERGWQNLLEHLDTETSDADLVAAEHALANAPTAAPARRGVNRWLAAAVALVGLNGITLAVGAGAIGVAVSSVVIWQERRHSFDTLSIVQAQEILVRPRSSQSDRTAAISEIFRRLKRISKALQAASDAPPTSVAEQAQGLLHELRSLARGEKSGHVTEITDQAFDDSKLIADQSADAALRLAAIARCRAFVMSTTAALHAMPRVGDAGDVNRDIALEKIATGNLR